MTRLQPPHRLPSWFHGEQLLTGSGHGSAPAAAAATAPHQQQEQQRLTGSTLFITLYRQKRWMRMRICTIVTLLAACESWGGVHCPMQCSAAGGLWRSQPGRQLQPACKPARPGRKGGGLWGQSAAGAPTWVLVAPGGQPRKRAEGVVVRPRGSLGSEGSVQWLCRRRQGCGGACRPCACMLTQPTQPARLQNAVASQHKARKRAPLGAAVQASTLASPGSIVQTAGWQQHSGTGPHLEESLRVHMHDVGAQALHLPLAHGITSPKPARMPVVRPCERRRGASGGRAQAWGSGCRWEVAVAASGSCVRCMRATCVLTCTGAARRC